MCSSVVAPRFEILPLAPALEQAAQLPEPVALTVTCSRVTAPTRVSRWAAACASSATR